MQSSLSLRRERVDGALRRLTGLSPEKVMERGFAFLADEDGKPVASVEDVKEGDRMVARVIDGTIDTRIIGTQQKDQA